MTFKKIVKWLRASILVKVSSLKSSCFLDSFIIRVVIKYPSRGRLLREVDHEAIWHLATWLSRVSCFLTLSIDITYSRMLFGIRTNRVKS